MNIVTRFAPSPTGFLHIGNARTALFSYLFARHNNGKFLLRIEDTDRNRSTDAATKAIFDGLEWLGIEYDGEAVFQNERIDRHSEIAHELLARDSAYKCYLTPEEIDQLKKDLGEFTPIKSPWRDKKEDDNGRSYVIRLKTPLQGETIVEDLVQGKVTTKNEIVDDLILLRSDGTPTYMLAVVVDDHDMGVTNVIRGDDHLNNTVKQIMIYKGMGWDVPKFAHIPLIHGPDGAKLSKRHGSLSVMEYKEMGYLPETMMNYLLRLGWSHGNDEVISKKQAIEWFNLESVGKSPSRLDFKKLDSLNSHYIKNLDNESIMKMILEHFQNLNESQKEKIALSLDSIKSRAKKISCIFEASEIYIRMPEILEDAKAFLKENNLLIKPIYEILKSKESWQKDLLMESIKNYASSNNLKFPDLACLLRVVITGRLVSPSIFEIMEILGKEEILARIANNGNL